ncbi:MAG: serine hydrolase domain-containing protein [Candidatus Heimdallarchaeota archaeon]
MNDEMRTSLTIFGENEEEIKVRMNNVLNNLLQPNFEKGIPAPNLEVKGKLADRMKECNVPGMSIAVLNNYQLEWAATYGVMNNDTKEPVNKYTMFESGSASKTFTAIAALCAVTQGLLDLDEDVNLKLKSWKIPENDFTKNKPVTLRQLLSHTAGINRPDSMFGSEPGKDPTINQILSGQKPALNDPAEVVFEPGTSHQYSNMGYIIIEQLLTDVFGKNFTELTEELVLGPIGMQNSIFMYPEGDLKQKLIVPHDKDGIPKESGLSRYAFAHGGLLSSPYDISNFLIDLMNTYQGKSEKVLSQKVLNQMLTPVIPLDPKKFFGFTGQGLGLFLIESGDDLFVTHPGTNMPGAVCMMMGSPTTGQGLAIMSNGIGAELLHLEILFAVAEEYDWPIYRA